MTEVLTWDVLRWIVIVTLWIFLGLLIRQVLALFLKAMTGSEENSRPGIWIEANWGGLGGGLSGWRVSNAVIYLLLLSLLLGCLSLAVVSLAPEKKGEEQKKEQKTETGKKEDQTKDVGKKDTDQKPEAAKTPDASTGDKDPKKSSNVPAPGKKADQ